MAADGVRGELSCPVCLEIYTDPVTLPCGHNYCRGCIGKAWDPEMRGFGDKPSCPQCRRRYEKQPELRSNVTLWDLAERFLPIGPHHGTTGIPCTYCDSPVPAAMSCLLCEASLCATHVRVHSTAPEHVLTMPSVLLRHQNCSIHRERLRYRCTEDGARVCVSCCLAGGPRGHKVELLNGAPKKTHIQGNLQPGLSQWFKPLFKVQHVVRDTKVGHTWAELVNGASVSSLSFYITLESNVQ
eukprot:XP_017945804.1 PREDICTED: probable E3 ubiquitin-protein ligase TRIM8 [Xenopus tropicalis]